MQGIVAWLRANPDEGRAIMRENKSYVFFRELDGPPLGALGLPVTGGVTVAADAKFVPLGAPVFLSMDRADANGLWIAQDTGGAIKGSQPLRHLLGRGRRGARRSPAACRRAARRSCCVPIGTLARLQGGASGGTTPQP